MKDWHAWHKHYDEPDSALAHRLQIVRGAISDSLPTKVENRYQIIDICAGDGRDLLPVLANYPNALLVHSLLVEIDKNLLGAASSLAVSENVPNITPKLTDASVSLVYEAVIPADLILLCGVLGNISEEDVENTISNLAMFCKAGTKVIWTRNRRAPDATPKIRKLFVNNGFVENAFIAPEHNTYAVGVSEFKATPKQFDKNIKLFTFVR